MSFRGYAVLQVFEVHLSEMEIENWDSIFEFSEDLDIYTFPKIILSFEIPARRFLRFTPNRIWYTNFSRLFYGAYSAKNL